MKLAFYALAAAALSGLALASRMPGAPPVEDIRAARERSGREEVVFVDLERLVSFHPAWTVVEDARRVLADFRNTPHSAAPGGSDARAEAESSAGSAEYSGFVRRSRLEAEAARRAVEALHELELEKRQLLWHRARSLREGMTRAAELSLAEAVYEIRKAAADETAACEARFSADRLRATLRVSALESACSIPELNSQQTAGRLTEAKRNLESTERALEAEKKGIASAAEARIAWLRESELQKVERRVEVFEASEKARIESEIAFARDGIITGLLSSRTAKADRDRVSPMRLNGEEPEAALRVSLGNVNSGRPGIRNVADENLVQLIVSDVRRAAREIAAQRGMRVVFKRSHGQFPDRTDEFAHIMTSAGWRFFGSVLGGVARS